MSWAVDDWMVGLSGRALQKVRELESQQEQLKREKQQRQLKLDSTEAALSKQKLKYDEVRSELAVAQRDLQSCREEAQAGLRARERLSQELQIKQAQVCSLEGQLDASRTLTQSLTQEVKRLEAELEKLQNASNSGDSTLFSTPCWSMSSSRDNGSQWEERSEYRGEGEIKALHARQLQFADCSPRSPLGGTVSPQQPHSSTPVRRPTRRSNSSNSSAVFPWEREDASSASSGRPVLPLQTTAEVSDVQFHQDCGMENDLRREIDVQRSKIQEMQTWVQSLEQEARSASEQRRGLEAQLAEVRAQLAAREQDLTRAREELTRSSASVEKEASKVLAAEQRLKQLQEELSCQRQNAESSRRSAEQSRRELEKEHRRELLELQKDRQTMEREHQQESSRLKQEIQRAQTLHNTLQAQCDKALLQKQALEKDLDAVRGKLQWTEKELLEKQKVEQQTQCKLTEALRERDGLAVRLDQSERRAKGLEEEVRRLTQELSEALRLLEEQKAIKLTVPATVEVPVRFTPAGDSLPSSTSHHERLQRALPAQKKKTAGRDPSRESWEVGSIDPSKAGYPVDREPGEGIDSNDITELGSQTDKLRDEAGRPKNEDQKTLEDEAELIAERNQCDVQGVRAATKEQNNTERENTELGEARKPHGHLSDDHFQAEEDEDPLIPSTGQDRRSQPALSDLKKQNVALSDELQEVKRELERRLEDLEAQRRAETEARTRLKQVSRKHSAQIEQLQQKAQELKGEGERLERELEEERAESGRLKETLAALEQRSIEGQVDAEKEAEESAVLRDQVARLESQLKQEREDWEQERELWSEEEDRRRMDKEHELESSRTFTARIEELEAQIVELRGRRETGNGFGEAPLITCDNAENFNNNSDNVPIDSMSPSPCNCPSQPQLVDPQSIRPFKHIESDFSNNEEGQVKPESNLEDPPKRNGRQVGLETVLFHDETVQLVLELERLRKACETLKDERDKEAERARQTQGKLDALQAQVNSQTQQLTLAFESQSCHIQDLLNELQDRDSVLERLEVELQGCREELKLLKTDRQELQLEGKSSKDIKSVLEVAVTPNPPLTSPILQCGDIKSMPQAFENLHPPTALSQQQVCDDGSSMDSLVRCLCVIIAGNKELKSELEAVTFLNNLEHKSTGDLIDGDTTHSVVVQLHAALNELMQLKTENKEIKSMLAAVTSPGRKEDHPLNSKGCLLDDNKESEAATKRSIKELHPAQRDPVLLNEYEHLTVNLKESVTRTVNPEELIFGQGGGGNPSNRPSSLAGELLLSKLQEKELKLKSDLCVQSGVGSIKAEEQDAKTGGVTCRSTTDLPRNQDELNQLEREKDQLDSQLAVTSFLWKPVAADTYTKDQEPGVSLQSSSEVIIKISGNNDLHKIDKPTVDVKQYIKAIITLLGENKALQSWALSVSPPEKQEEMPDISEGVLGWIDSIINGFGSEKFNSVLPWSTDSEKEVTEVSRERVMAIPKTSMLSPAQDLSSSSNKLDLKTEDAQGIQTVTEGSNLIAHGVSHPGYCLTEAVTVTQTDAELRKENQQLKEPLVLLRTSVQEQEGSPGVQDSVTQTEPEEDGLLQQQLLELQSVVSSLVEENKRQANELKVWRMAGDTLTPVSYGEPLIQMGNDSITVVREDHLLVSCKAGKLVRSPPDSQTTLEDCRKPVSFSGAVDKGAHGERESCHLSGAHGETGTPALSAELSSADGDVFQSFKAKAAVHGQSELQTETTHSYRNHTDIQIFIQEDQVPAAKDTQSRTKRADRDFDQENQLRAAAGKTASEKITMVVQEDNWTKAVIESEAIVNSKGENPAFTVQHSGMMNEKGPPMQSKGADLEQVQDCAAEGAESVVTSGKTTCLFSKNPVEDGESSFPQGETRRQSRSMATQTEGMNEGAAVASRAPCSSDQEKCHTGTQTEDRVMEEWSQPADSEAEGSADSPPLSPMDAAMPVVGNMNLFSGSFPIPADPARLAERIRRNRSRMSAAFDDTEYEPYGLPEVVMKGFADIPSGPACPYVLRRGLLGTDAMPLPLREQEESEKEDALDP